MKKELLTIFVGLLLLPAVGADVRRAPEGGAPLAGHELGTLNSRPVADLAKEYRAQHIQDLEIAALDGDELSMDELSVSCPREYKAVIITLRQMAKEEKRAQKALAERQRKVVKLELPPEPSGPVAKDAAEFAAKYSLQPAAITCQTNQRAGTISYRVECKDANELKTMFETLKRIPNRIRISQGTNYVALAVRLKDEKLPSSE